MKKSYRIILIWASMCYAGYQTAQTPSDVAADAKLIVDSNRAELIVMRIIPFRSSDERIKINDEVRTLGVTPLIDDKYMPVSPLTRAYSDLCFILIYPDKITILSKYMAHFLDSKDETTIIITMVLVDKMADFIKAYDDLPDNDSFEKARKDQRKPFQNMLRVWAESNRPADDKVDPAQVDKEVGNLIDEMPKWDETRDQLEKVLMKSSYPMAKAILEKYEEKNKHPIEDDIKSKIKNADLVDAYSSLATYIKDKYKYLATKLHDHSNGKHNWVVWNLLIGVLQPDDWKQIDASFKKEFDNIGVVEFISHNIFGDFVLMETFAYIIDSSYKPKFIGVPAPIATAAQPPAPAVQPASPGSALPSVPPTTVVPPVPPASPPAG